MFLMFNVAVNVKRCSDKKHRGYGQIAKSVGLQEEGRQQFRTESLSTLTPVWAVE